LPYRGIASTVLSLAAVAATAQDLQLPALRPGLWEYHRTQVTSAGGKPKTTTLRRCTDPNGDFTRKLAELTQRGCTFKPMRHNGKQYVASWRCTTPDGAVLAMRDIITVNSDTSYLNESEAVVSHEATHSTTVANRVGDCSTAQSNQSPH
jgi:hypothetical protein